MASHLKCPKCKRDSKVLAKYVRQNGVVVRYRMCPECKGRFTTKVVYVRYKDRLIEDEVLDTEVKYICDGTIETCLACWYDVCILDKQDAKKKGA